MMDRLFIGALALLIATAPVRGASSIDTTVPAQGADFDSAPIRQNFTNAASDINKLQSRTAGPSQPAGLATFQDWMNTAGCPTACAVYMYDGTVPVQWGTLNQTTHAFGVALSSTNVAATAPITAGFSGGTATLGLSIDSNFAVVANALALANVTSGKLLANCTGSTSEPTGCTASAWLDQVFGTTLNSTLTRGASFWGTTILGTAAQAATGSSYVLGNALGGSASSPITLSSTTGNIACATCVTSSGGGAITGTAPISVSAAGVVSITGAAGQILAGAGPGFTGTPTLGVAGSALGSLAFANLTSGSVTVQAVAGALGSSVLSLPAATDTLIARATTDILTNKTYDSAGTGNVFKLSGSTVTTASSVLDVIGATRGSVLYRGAAGWSILTPGTSGFVLTSGGPGSDPNYTNPAGGGTVTSVTFSKFVTADNNPCTTTCTANANSLGFQHARMAGAL